MAPCTVRMGQRRRVRVKRTTNSMCVIVANQPIEKYGGNGNQQVNAQKRVVPDGAVVEVAQTLEF